MYFVVHSLVVAVVGRQREGGTERGQSCVRINDLEVTIALYDLVEPVPQRSAYREAVRRGLLPRPESRDARDIRFDSTKPISQ